jgi:hypothetical protein
MHVPRDNAKTQEDSSTTFVKPLYEGSSQLFTPYAFSEDVIPPPPPYLYQQLPHQSKRHRWYVIAIALLTLLVVGLGTLEVFQIAGGKLLAHDPNGNIYEGTGKLNNVFILSAGQIMLVTEIFSFLPRPGVPYTLITRLGVSGLTYEPVQFTF